MCNNKRMRAKCSEIRHPNNEEALYRRSGKSIGRSLSSHHNNNKTVAGCDIDNELLQHYFEFAKFVSNPLAISLHKREASHLLMMLNATVGPCSTTLLAAICSSSVMTPSASFKTVERKCKIKRNDKHIDRRDLCAYALQ